jgi:alpha-L-fucosidase
MLNLPLNADGELDPGGEQVLAEMAEWIAVNGEGIYGTRPWKVFGEGTTRMPNGNLGRAQDIAFTAADFRFLAKGPLLYAFCMTIPQEPVLIKSLGYAANLGDKSVTSVRILGSDCPVSWLQTDTGLMVSLPERWPCQFAAAFVIQF